MRLNGYTEQQIQQQCVFLRGESIEHALSQVEVPFDGVFAYRDQQAWEIATIVSPHIKIIGFDNVQSILKLPFQLAFYWSRPGLEAQWVAEWLLKRIKDPARPTKKESYPPFWWNANGENDLHTDIKPRKENTKLWIVGIKSLRNTA